MKYFIKTNRKKDLVILSIVYLLSQGMLLLVSGRWWDDWCLYNLSDWALKEWSSQLGRPDFYYIEKVAAFFPEGCYRIATFVLFYYCMLYTYRITKVWLNSDDRGCFWISALYAVIPVNDGRIALADFPYTIGLFFFMMGLCLFSTNLFDNKLTSFRRILVLILFFFSFVLNSNLCFYMIVYLMIWMKEKRIKRCFRYTDFLLLPLIFFLPKIIFFKSYGAYEGYNTLNWGNLPNSIKLTIYANFVTLYSVCKNWICSLNSKYLILLLGIIFLSILVITKRKAIKEVKAKNVESLLDKILEEEEKDEHPDSTIRLYTMLFVGVVCLSAGLFAYVTIRNTCIISTIGFAGRDSVLLALGVAIILYCIIELCMRKWMRKYIYIGFLFMGTVYFNTLYLSYQQDYYRQLGFQYQLRQHQELDDLKNIIYINYDSGTINNKSTVQLNANSSIALGREDKLYIAGFENLFFLADSIDTYEYYSIIHHQSEYDYTNKVVDAVIKYDFDTNLLDVIHIKGCEIFNHTQFEKKIQDCSGMNVFLRGTKEFEQMIAQYERLCEAKPDELFQLRQWLDEMIE